MDNGTIALIVFGIVVFICAAVWGAILIIYLVNKNKKTDNSTKEKTYKHSYRVTAKLDGYYTGSGLDATYNYKAFRLVINADNEKDARERMIVELRERDWLDRVKNLNSMFGDIKVELLY